MFLFCSGRFAPPWGSSDFPSNRARFREEVQEKLPDHTNIFFSLSRMTFFRSIAVVCDVKMLERLSWRYFF